MGVETDKCHEMGRRFDTSEIQMVKEARRWVIMTQMLLYWYQLGTIPCMLDEI